MKNLFIKIIISAGFLLVISCNINCEKIAEIDRISECLIIVQNKPDSTSVYNFEIVGRSLNTNKDTLYKEENRWFCSYYDSISVGDTIIKEKGTLVFKIHKKGHILNFPWECEGKIYK